MSTPQEDILKPFLELEGLEDSQKVMMFIMICDEKILIQHLQKQAMMRKVGMVEEDPIYSFAYSILRLAKPYLFDDEGNLRGD